MNRRRTIWTAIVLTPLLLAAGFWLQRQAAVDLPAAAAGGPAAPQPRLARAMFLGYNGLAADIYWTEAIQYFGGRHLARSRRYPRLAPLLNLSYSLDPDLLAAAEYGAFFLADRPPFAAGQPQAAVDLLRRAIRHHPSRWRLYYDLGFVYALNLHQRKKAAEAFLAGSKVHPTNPAMKVLAADYFGQANQTQLAAALWSQMYRNAPNADLRANALDHLQALRARADIQALERLLAAYHHHFGRWPRSWSALISLGALHGVPLGPQGRAYVLLPGGKVRLNPATKIAAMHAPS